MYNVVRNLGLYLKCNLLLISLLLVTQIFVQNIASSQGCKLFAFFVFRNRIKEIVRDKIMTLSFMSTGQLPNTKTYKIYKFFHSTFYQKKGPFTKKSQDQDPTVVSVKVAQIFQRLGKGIVINHFYKHFLRRMDLSKN